MADNCTCEFIGDPKCSTHGGCPCECSEFNKFGTCEHLAKPEPVKLSAEDKLTVKTLETEAYKEQLRLQDAQTKAQNAINALNSFLRTLSEKYDRDPKEYLLNLETLEYVQKGPGSGSGSDSQ